MGYEKKEQKSLLDAYAFSVGYTGLTTFIGHPVERLKVAIQTNLSKSSYSVVNQFSGSNLKHFSTGLTSCLTRQLSKGIYRPLLMTHMPKNIDRLQLPMLAGGALKAGIASAFDTLIISPAENVKTVQMRAIASQAKPMNPVLAMNTIYNQRGVLGFFSGTTVALGKALPSWMYLFMTYDAIKSKREKETFLSTILWATASSVPLVLATTPLDVLKSQQQACNDDAKQTLRALGTQLYKNHGVSAFFKGFNCRLVHKSMSVAGAYMLFDMAPQL